MANFGAAVQGAKGKKRKVFTQIAAYTSLNEQGKMPEVTDVFPSVNNSKDVVPFLLDVLGVILGTEALKLLTGELFTNFLGGIEPKLKDALTKQVISSNADTVIPSGTEIFVSTGNMDVFSEIKALNTDAGSYLNDSSLPNFNSIVNDVIVNPGTEKTFAGVADVSYDQTTDKIKLKPLAGLTIGAFLTAFIAGMVIINQKEITAKVMDLLYGTISSSNKKTVEQVKTELTVRKAIDQYVEDGDDTFVVNPKYNEEILKKATEISKGITTYDMGCGTVSVSLSVEDLGVLIAAVSGSTDPFVVGNAFDATITAAAVNNNPETTKENQETIKDGFFKQLINLLTTTLIESITLAPQIRALLAMVSSFSNNGVSKINNAVDDINNFTIFIKCNVNELTNLLIEFIMTIAIGALNKLLVPIIKKVIKEKINQYVNTIKSLLPVKIPDVVTVN